MKKKLFVISLVVLLVYLPLFSQNSKAVEKNSTGVTLSAQKINPGKDKKYEKSIQKKNYDKYEYDVAGRITRVISKDKGEIKYIYNEYGKLESKIKSNIESEHYRYDKLGRNTRIEFKSYDEEDSVTFKYSTPEESYKLGNLVEKIENNEHSFYKYAGRRLKEEKKIIRGKEFLVKYNYNEKGLLSEIHYPSGLIVSYSYDNKNIIEDIFITKDNKKTSVLKYIRGEGSSILKFRNGLETILDVDKEKRTTSMKTGDLQDLEFIFNGKGFIEKVIDKLNRKNKKEFYYDTQDRLITAYGPWGKIIYRYDSMDNLTAKIEKDCKIELSYNKKSARIKELKKNGKRIDVKYDRLGRMTQYGEMSFSYNTRGRLEKILKNNDVLVELFYNCKNQRVVEKRESKEFYYIYDNQDRVLAKYDNEGNKLKEYIYSKEILVGFLKDNIIYNYHYDLMNFPVLISDESGKIVKETQYKPYGEIISNESEIDDNSRFPGQFKINGTQLHYNLNRTYFSVLGRYLEPERIINVDNLYQYARCNPVIFGDINGNSCQVKEPSQFWQYLTHRSHCNIIHKSVGITGGAIVDINVESDLFFCRNGKSKDKCYVLDVGRCPIKMYQGTIKFTAIFDSGEISLSDWIKLLKKIVKVFPGGFKFKIWFKSNKARKFPDIEDFKSNIYTDEIKIDVKNNDYWCNIGNCESYKMELVGSFKPDVTIINAIPEIKLKAKFISFKDGGHVNCAY